MSDSRVATLPVMHDGYRLSVPEMRALVAHVRGGGSYTEPVCVTRFEDGRVMLRDGLHRATAVMLARPSGALGETELMIEDMTYAMFLEPAFDAGLLAPFDPRCEVRIADFRAHRDEVRSLLSAGGDANAFIAANRHSYVRPRRPYHESLAMFYAACSPYGDELAT